MIISPSTNNGDLLSVRMSNAVFLAGPCPREDYEDDWRKEAIRILQDSDYKGDIINPTNPNYDGDLIKQTAWEHTALSIASRILFWIPRDKKHPALTTNIEFGEWMSAPNVFVGFPDNSEKNEYIAVRINQLGGKIYNTLESLCQAVCYIEGKPKTVFTSDTHFGSQRTLELHCRPFRNTDEMDLTMISNWNKMVSPDDTVIHLGDIGNVNVLKVLNFKKMYFVPGNYEKKDHSIIDELSKDQRVVICKSRKKITLNGKTYYLCHEPINGGGEDKFYLYGHIHRLQMIKKNGINVGQDVNRFKPVLVSEIEWMRNGMEKYYDENVFTDKCK